MTEAEVIGNTKHSQRISYKRDKSLDLLKLLGIAMVILIHCIPLVYGEFKQLVIYQLCCLIADPLFFFASGYLFGQKNYLSNKRVQKFIRSQLTLLCAFLFFAIIKVAVHNDFRNLYKIFVYPHNGLWFIFSLFFIKWAALISVVVCEKFFSEQDLFAKLATRILSFFLIIFLFYVAYVFFGDVFELGHTAVYSLFFGIGWFWPTVFTKILHNRHAFINALVLLLLALGSLFCFLLFYFKNWFDNREPFAVLFRLLTSGFFVLLLHRISFFAVKFGVFSFVSIIGRYSLGSYFVSSLLIDSGCTFFGLNNRYHDGNFFRFLFYYLLILIASVLLSLGIYTIADHLKSKFSGAYQ